jgi:hypothetical protein
MAAGGLMGALLAAAPAAAAELSAADLAWIDKCIADRKIERLDPVKLRKYCECMQGIVEDDEPFTVSELERSYPPAHAMCHDRSGLGEGR